ncbi:MAG: tripartite tricarboxylate transporter TctB family protein [Hungatella sp.]|nr:tripartite tricarboxylate transporter TctB family protein [Hungatella sp.]
MKKIPSNLVGGLLSLAVGAGIVLLTPGQIQDIYSDQTGVTSASVPCAIGYILAVLGVGLMVMSLVFHREDDVVIHRSEEMMAAGVFGVLLYYVFAMEYMGYLLNSIIAATAILLLQKNRSWKIAAATLGTVAAIYVIFIYFFGVQLPAGRLWV